MRVYAVREDAGVRLLVELICDGPCCSPTARIKPHPEIAESGWTKHGRRDAFGSKFEWDYCPRCS